MMALGWLPALVLLAAPPPASPPASTPTPGAAYLELANRLRSQAEFDSCAIEALRAGYVEPAARPVAFERAALCLDLAHRYGDARRLVLTLGGDAKLSAKARYRLCYTEVFLPDRDLSPECDAAEVAAPASDRDAQLAAYTQLMRALSHDRWAEARARLAAPPSGPLAATLASWEAEDLGLLAEHDRLPHKSPWIAGGLSALFPGLGRAYLGRWADAVFSLILVGAPAGFAAHDFYRNGVSSVPGWLLAALAGGFYAGNVYGSAVGAVVFNRQEREALDARIQGSYAQRADP